MFEGVLSRSLIVRANVTISRRSSRRGASRLLKLLSSPSSARQVFTFPLECNLLSSVAPTLTIFSILAPRCTTAHSPEVPLADMFPIISLDVTISRTELRTIRDCSSGREWRIDDILQLVLQFHKPDKLPFRPNRIPPPTFQIF